MKKLTKLVFAVTTCLLLTACGDKYTLCINVSEDWDGNKALLVVPKQANVSEETIDTIVLTAPQTIFEGKVKAPQYATLVVIDAAEQPLNQIAVILEKGTIDVSEEAFAGSGTPLNDLLTTYFEAIKPLMTEYERLFYAYLEASDDSESMHAIEAEADKVMEQYQETNLDFIKANLDNPVGVMLFMSSYSQYSEEMINDLLATAPKSFFDDPAVAEVAQAYDLLKRTAAGQHFTDFEMNNLAGEPCKLSDFADNGKYLVVDFWASWCAPCRRSMPELKNIYTQYNDRIEIVGVSFDNKQEDWEKCVKTLELPWQHMSDLKGWQSIAADIYGVHSIPHIMLIDPDGIIIAKGLNDNSLRKELEKIFEAK